MPMPNASMRGRKYGSSELTLVRGMRWRIVNAARQRRDGPWTAIDARADEPQAGPDHEQRDEVAGQKQRLERDPGRAREGGEHLVDDHEPPLRVDQRRITGKERGIERPDDDRDVERLVGRRRTGSPLHSRLQAGRRRRRRRRSASEGRLVGAGTVHRRNRHVQQPQVHAQLCAVMNDVAQDERPQHRGLRHREDRLASALERPDAPAARRRSCRSCAARAAATFLSNAAISSVFDGKAPPAVAPPADRFPTWSASRCPRWEGWRGAWPAAPSENDFACGFHSNLSSGTRSSTFLVVVIS